MLDGGFLDKRRLLHGPWQAFERDIARLLIANGYSDVRIVGGSGDHGADVLGVIRNELWVFQCKHTTTSPPPRSAVEEVIRAGEFYGADRLLVATSRPPSSGFLESVANYRRRGLEIDICDPTTLLGLMKGTPPYSKHYRKLRDYQEDAVDRLRNALLDTGRGQIVLATGLGKTVVLAEAVSSLYRDERIPHGRTLVLAHTRELVNQLHQSFWYQLPKWVPTHQFTEGERPLHWEGITFATIQSVMARASDLPEFGLVIVDEAHHIGADMFQRTLRELKPAMLAGSTATPWRGDGYDIDSLLGPPLIRVGIAEGLQRGFLSEVDYRLLADNLDWDVVQTLSTHNYSLKQLNRKLLIPTRDEQAARLIKQAFEEEARQSGLVFSPTIAHANAIAAVLRRYGLRAESISTALAPRERDKLMSRFRKGDIDILASVDLFNEGVDVPDVDIVCFMRTTHSRRIFVQQLGRGLRISPDKDKVIVLDFVTDLRRVAEVLELDRAVRDGPIENLGMGSRIVRFTDSTAGDFLREWMLDQASLFMREESANLELPRFEFPEVPPSGSVQ